MNIIQEIVKNTKANLTYKRAELSLKQIKSSLEDLDLPRGRFKDNISNKDEAIIGASALSILTEEDFFMGSTDYLKKVKKITALPILRKDFIIDEYQIYESKLIGADCILFISSILSNQQIEDFVNIAKKLQLDY